MIKIIAVNCIIFLLSFNISSKFLRVQLFKDQEIKMKLNQYIFSGTFSLCILMLALFIQDVWNFHDNK